MFISVDPDRIFFFYTTRPPGSLRSRGDLKHIRVIIIIYILNYYSIIFCYCNIHTHKHAYVRRVRRTHAHTRERVALTLCVPYSVLVVFYRVDDIRSPVHRRSAAAGVTAARQQASQPANASSADDRKNLKKNNKHVNTIMPSGSSARCYVSVLVAVAATLASCTNAATIVLKMKSEFFLYIIISPPFCFYVLQTLLLYYETVVFIKCNNVQNGTRCVYCYMNGLGSGVARNFVFFFGGGEAKIPHYVDGEKICNLRV